MLPRASFLVRGGYNVLALDLRGHGESAAQYVSPGYLEARDVLYVLEQTPDRPLKLEAKALRLAGDSRSGCQL